MQRLVLIVAVLVGVAAGVAAPAQAVTQVLMPGVTYQRQIQFTAHGPVVINVIRAPKPGGLYSLKPVLANGTITGRQRVTAMQKAISSTATVAGVNGDLFNWTDGHPSGLVIQDGVIESPPVRTRSSIGISTTGTLNVARVALYGYWQGLGSRRPITVNKTPKGDGTSLFTPAWGAKTPAVSGAVVVVLRPFPPATSGGVLQGTVVSQGSGVATPIPPDGAVLVAVGSQAPKLAAEAPVGTPINVQLVLTPDWPAAGIDDALGGGPVIVRNGKAVYTAGEDFLPSQLAPRDPRTGIGQRKDGKIVMVAVDGRHPGYSVGLTNFELAQALVRLGAVTGSALDAGGSTTMAFDGKLLNRPSDPGGERSIKEMLAVMYYGVYAAPPTLPVVSPNGDGSAEKQTLSFKVVRPSTVTASLIDPTGATAFTDTGPRAPGTYKVTWPATMTAKREAQEALGRWRWVVNATDDLARQSSVERSFWVNDTLGFVSVSPKVVRLGPKRANRVVVRFQLAHNARVVVSVWTRSGVLVRRIGAYKMKAGRRSVRWNGRFAGGHLAYRGTYLFKVYAQNAYGPVDLTKVFGVRR
ncbi:MAG TPA: phosphodiester glycosidase family protein [Gaiellaceae bacterium]|nr:phosphodiester glycosidase family protein [Gaiellaceae bacterium]